MIQIGRRGLVAAGAGAAVAGALARPGLAQGRPERLRFVGTSAGQFHSTFVEEVAPAFEKKTGIKVEFTLLPIDALSAKLRAELSAKSDSIDIIEWTSHMGPWLAPHLVDHEAALAAAAGRRPDYDWADYLGAVKTIAQYDGRQLGIPYRVTSPILFYQKPVLEAVGITKPPSTYAEYREAAVAVTKAGKGERYGVGFMGRQGSAIISGWAPYLMSNGGNFLNPKTNEILINRKESVEALDFYAGLLLRDKVAPPEVTTWEFDEVIANGQSDRYAMGILLSPYGALVNNPKLSKTAGNWAFAAAPGGRDPAQSKVTLGGWIMSVSEHGKHKDWALDFIMMATNKEWLRRSMYRGNAAPRTSVLLDAEIQQQFPFTVASVASFKTGEILPQTPSWPALEQRLRVGLSQTLLGEAAAQPALDAVAADWQRSLRRAGAVR